MESCLICMQGLLTAMAAKVRSKQRHLASTAPSLLQFTSTRTATDKALKDAEIAVEAALQAIAGILSACYHDPSTTPCYNNCQSGDRYTYCSDNVSCYKVP